MSARPHLWTFRRCPYAIRARLAIDVSQVEVEYREILLRDKPTQMLADSPKGTVPVCVLPSGEVLEESLDIMRWALEQNDPERWLPSSADEDALSCLWIGLGDSFKPLLDRYKYANRFPTETHETTNAACRAHLEDLETQLNTSPFLLGDRLTLADAALFPFVRQFHFCDVDQLARWNLAALRRWLESNLKSERFERVMTKRALWKPQ